MRILTHQRTCSLQAWPAGGLFYGRGMRRSGFTLVEVILAIGIAVGILVVALVFYQQSANLRTQVIGEAERIAAIRLVYDRLASDLRSAFQQPQIGFTGTSDSMEFVMARPSDASTAWARSGPSSDLRKVSYVLTASLEGTNFVITGLDRTENSLVARPTPVPAGTLGTGASANSSAAASLPTTITGQGAFSSATNATPAEPFAEAIQFVRFRYWDGSAWLEAWDSSDLPRAVEVALGTQALSEGDAADVLPEDAYRRVILLPARTSAEEDWWAGL